jgi:Fe2+ transport system protein FeoA
LFVPDQRPLHFTICSYCAKKPTYSACTFVSKAKATEAADGHTAGYDCYCGYKTNAKIAKIASVKLEKTKYTYDAKVKTPTVTVKDSAGKTLKKDTDYTVTYASGRKNAGEYTVTVNMKGNYIGTKTATFRIVPGKAGIRSAKEGKGKVKVTMSKKAGAIGGKYDQIKYRVKGKSSWKTVKTTSKAKTIKGLKKGKKYQIKVRTFKKVGGSTEMKKHLEDMGFVTGSIVTVVSSIDGNLIVNIKETKVALDKNLANKIMIQ